MPSTIWHPWKDNRNKEELKPENQDKVSEKPAASEDVQQVALNCYR